MAFLLGGVPMLVRARFNYVTNNGSITITGYTGPGGVVTIPSTIDGLSVTAIGVEAFFTNMDVTAVTIPGTVTILGESAFAGCDNLTDVVLQIGVADIGPGAFEDCPSLASCPLPNTVTNIEEFAFHNCDSLTTITLPEHITSIAEGTFEGSGLVSITIPNSVTNLSDGAFLVCNSLCEVDLGSGVANIGVSAFLGCSVTNITFPSSVTNIGDGAFYDLGTIVGAYFKGNKPSGSQNVFIGGSGAIVYYLPGTTGWGASYGGLPALLWNPQAQTADGGFGVRSNGFGFNIIGTTNIPVVVVASTNLAGAEWTALQGFTLTNGSVYFSDLNWTNYRGRFYRFRAP